MTPAYLSEFIAEDPEAEIWDVVVVGTGAGGGTAGFNLARRGRSVLFLERGAAPSPRELTASDTPLIPIPGTVRSVEQGSDKDEAASPTAYPSPALWVRCGIGGSMSVYAMIMDRFRPIDFEAAGAFRLPPNTSAPERWPIQYEDMEPYYREAESLFRVRGADDPLTPAQGPLRAPVAPSDADSLVQNTLAQCGLHPYPIHYAREFVPNCTGCPAIPCSHQCRNDAARMCVIPALQTHNARYLPDCTVIRLDGHGYSVQRAICQLQGRRISIRGRVFILALNAIMTPALLLRSWNEAFPEGLGNRSGMVGRNLMLHVSDKLLVRFRGARGLNNGLLRTGASLNDFYVNDSFKLGNIHAHALPSVADKSNIADKHDDCSVSFNTVVEDFPYENNFVSVTSGTDNEVFWEYDYRRELRYRSEMLRRLFIRSLASECEIVPKTPVGALNAAHMCGTCRFGKDATSSVLDENNRIHDVDNVYVLDASFFPSSGGINPSLTIVANSLRVSTRIGNEW